MTTETESTLKSELQRLRQVAEHALDLRHSIYYAADPGTKIEKWANELGAVLHALEWGLRQFDRPKSYERLGPGGCNCFAMHSHDGEAHGHDGGFFPHDTHPGSGE